MLIFLDLETTGLDVEDKVCSIGLVSIDSEQIESMYELVYEGRKVSPKASSVNHITNEMLKDKPVLNDSEAFQYLNEHNNSDTIIIGHNPNFDMQKLSEAGFTFQGSLIDTLRVSKHLIPDCESYALQVLRYELKLYHREMEDLKAHHALDDAKLVKILYEYLLELSTTEELLELTHKNVLLEKFSFGKYSGRYIEEIMIQDRGYLEWMLANIVDLDDDLRYSINYYLQG